MKIYWYLHRHLRICWGPTPRYRGIHIFKLHFYKNSQKSKLIFSDRNQSSNFVGMDGVQGGTKLNATTVQENFWRNVYKYDHLDCDDCVHVCMHLCKVIKLYILSTAYCILILSKLNCSKNNNIQQDKE